MSNATEQVLSLLAPTAEKKVKRPLNFQSTVYDAIDNGIYVAPQKRKPAISLSFNVKDTDEKLFTMQIAPLEAEGMEVLDNGIAFLKQLIAAAEETLETFESSKAQHLAQAEVQEVEVESDLDTELEM